MKIMLREKRKTGHAVDWGGIDGLCSEEKRNRNEGSRSYGGRDSSCPTYLGSRGAVNGGKRTGISALRSVGYKTTRANVLKKKKVGKTIYNGVLFAASVSGDRKIDESARTMRRRGSR